jgi:hypothetical protein
MTFRDVNYTQTQQSLDEISDIAERLDKLGQSSTSLIQDV